MSTVRYAAYGSNLHPQRLAARAGSARLLGAGRVPGWSLRFHKLSDNDGSGKCCIIESDESIYVAAYEIAAEEMTALDRIEGLGVGYDRAAIGVPRFGECITYVARASHLCETLQPFDWYKAMVVRGCRALALPSDYIATVDAVEAVADPDEVRRIEQWKIVERLSMDR